MNGLIDRILENILLFRLAIYVLSDSLMFYFLYTRLESVHLFFEKAGIDVEFFVKMIIAALNCVLMTLITIFISNKQLSIFICIFLTVITFFLMNHLKVIEVWSDDQ